MAGGEYFDVLGVEPALGRFFSAEHDKTLGAHPVVVLSHDFWRRRLNSDPAAVGSTILLNDTAFTILGVAARGFFGEAVGQRIDLWTPLAMQAAISADASQQRNWIWLKMFGRLRPGVTREAAEAELTTLLRESMRKDPTPPRSLDSWKVRLTPAAKGWDEFARSIGKPLQLLMGMVALVLLIACANVANLLLARASRPPPRDGRASRARLRTRPPGPPTAHREPAAGRDRRPSRTVRRPSGASAFCSSCSPTVRSRATSSSNSTGGCSPSPPRPPLSPECCSASHPRSALPPLRLLPRSKPAVPNCHRRAYVAEPRAGGDAGCVFAGRAGERGPAGPLAAQPARRRHRVRPHADAGLRSERFFRTRVEDLTPDRLRTLQQRLHAIPGVRAASLSAYGLMSGAAMNTEISHANTPPDAKPVRLRVNPVSPGYFRTVGTRILYGREFTSADAGPSARVVVISESAARKLFGNEPPLGKLICRDPKFKPEEALAVIGIAADARHDSIRRDTSPMIYPPMFRLGGNFLSAEFRIAAPAGHSRARDSARLSSARKCWSAKSVLSKNRPTSP